MSALLTDRQVKRMRAIASKDRLVFHDEAKAYRMMLELIDDRQARIDRRTKDQQELQSLISSTDNLVFRLGRLKRRQVRVIHKLIGIGLRLQRMDTEL